MNNLEMKEELGVENNMSGNENRSFLLEENNEDMIASNNDEIVEKKAKAIDLDTVNDLGGVLDENLNDRNIKYIDTEHSLEIKDVKYDNIDEDQPLMSIGKMALAIRDGFEHSAFVREVEKIGEDVARYKWAYDEGEFGEFNGRSFAKEVFKAGARGFGSSNLFMISDMLKMLGTNVKNRNFNLGVVTQGVSLVAPNAGDTLNELGEVLENLAYKFNDLSFLKPDSEVFDEDPNWMNLANIIGQGAGNVLSMGGVSKVIGSKATYGLFALGGAGDIFDESMEKDGNINKANLLASSSAGLNYAVDRILNPLPRQVEKGVKTTSKLIAKEILNAPVREGGSEMIQQVIADNLVRKVGIDDTQLLFEGLIESAIGGMAGSMSLVGVDGAIYDARNTYNNAKNKIMLRGVSKEDLDLYEKNMLELFKENPMAFDKILRYNLEQNMNIIKEKSKGIVEKIKVGRELKDFSKIYDEMYNRFREATGDEKQSRAVARLFEANALFLKEIGGDVSFKKLKEEFLPKIKKDNFLDFAASVNAKTSNFQFAGINAKTVNYEKVAEFIEMEKNNVDPQKIWQHTGLIRGSDGELRFEINDDNAKLKLWENMDYEEQAAVYHREIIHDLELMKSHLAYMLSRGKGSDFDALYQDFYKYLQEHDSEFEKLEIKREFDDPYLMSFEWEEILDEGILLRRENEEIAMADLWEEYQNGVRDFNEEDGKVIEGIKEKKRFDEFVNKYWKDPLIRAPQKLGREIRKDTSQWILSDQFVERMKKLARNFQQKRHARADELERKGIVDKRRFYHDLDLEETYELYLAKNGDISENRADRYYRSSAYKKAYEPATMGEKFMALAQYNFVDEMPKKVMLAYLDNVERFYRLEKYINFAKEVEKKTNIKANRSLVGKARNNELLNDIEKKRLIVSNGKEFLLEDVLEHKELFEAYPDLQKSTISFTRLKDDEPYHFYWNKNKGYVFEIDAEQLDYSMLTDILLKGTSFAIAHKEGYDYTLTDKQRKNFMDRHIYLAKKSIEGYQKIYLEKFLTEQGLLKKKSDVDKYWKKMKMPVSLLNLYKSESINEKSVKDGEYIQFGEVDFDLLTKEINDKFQPSDDIHQEYIRKQVTSDLYNFRNKLDRMILSVARVNSGYRDVGHPWGGLVSQGKNDERDLLKHLNYKRGLKSDIYFNFFDEGDSIIDEELKFDADIIGKVKDVSLQYQLDKKALDFVNKKAANGAYDFYNNMIYLFENADSETIVHETFHHFYNFLEKSGEKNNMLVSDLYSLMNDIKIDFIKNYDVKLYNGKYYAMYKNGMGVIDNLPVGFDSREELLDNVSKEIFVERMLRAMDNKLVNIYSIKDDDISIKPTLRIKVDLEKMDDAANLYIKWLKFMTNSLSLKDKNLSEGGKKVKNTILNVKKNK